MSDDRMMSDDDTLLAHLVPLMTKGVEDAATNALAYILNKSEPCRKAFVDLLSDDDFRLDDLQRVRTQAVREDRSRLDLVGYDDHGSERLIVESKFGATLLEGQVSGYLRHLDSDKSGVLLFVAPEHRRATLWREMDAQMRGDNEHPPLSTVHDDERIRIARVGDTGKRLALTTWTRVLDELKRVAPDLTLQSEIGQLASLAISQGDRRFVPLHPEDLSESLPRRILDFNRIINDVIDAHGVSDRWMSVDGYRSGGGSYGFGRYFAFLGEDQETEIAWPWLGISYEQWIAEDGTPIWLQLDGDTGIESSVLRRHLSLPDDWHFDESAYIPIRLRTGATYDDVLADVVRQVNAIRDIILRAREQAEADGLAAENADSAEDPGVADSGAP